MKHNILFLIIALATLCNSCIEEIRLDIDNDQQFLVVDGLITDSLQVHTIKLHKSAVLGVGNDNILTPVANAQVMVLDNTGGSVYFPEAEAGIYESVFQGVPGRSYQLQVQLESGQKVLSHPGLLRQAPPIDDIYIGLYEEESLSVTQQIISTTRIEVRLDTRLEDPDNPPFLRWRAMGEYEFWEVPGTPFPQACYIRDLVDLNVIKVIDGSKVSDGQLKDELFLTTAFNYRFSDLYFFHIIQYAISKEEYEYWNAVRDIVNLDGSLFDPPPGTVRGNLYDPENPDELILGYFTVAGLQYKRAYTSSSMLGSYIRRKCLTNAQNQGGDCADCTSIPFSKTERPYYWIP